MAIPTSRTKTAAEIHIQPELCEGCGLCVSVCKDFSITMRDGKVSLSDGAMFGCIGCGHCMAVCPTGAITIYGRELSPADLFDLPARKEKADYRQLLTLYQRRRALREFKSGEIEDELLEKILEAAQTAPMGLPPTDVHVLVLQGRSRNQQFARDYSAYLQNLRYLTSSWFQTLMRPFWGAAMAELFRGFIRPLFKAYTDDFSDENNLINYDAPLAMYFYATPWADPADPIIAATYAMLAAESLGLGTCMLGGIHPFIQNGRRARKFRAAYGIKHQSKEGLFVIFGYPAVRYRKGLRRNFADIQVLS